MMDAQRTTTGVVRFWLDEEGWGVVDSPETPGGCWAHFSSVQAAGYRGLAAGQDVHVEWERGDQDGYAFRAVRTWPVGQDPEHRVTGGLVVVANEAETAVHVHVAKTMSFGYDGDGGLGDRLLAAVLRGEKTATSSLAVEYLSGESLPRVGERLPLVDHRHTVYGMVETTRVTIIPMHLVGDDVARDEGEGFANASDWRRAHVAFWTETIDMIREDAGDPEWVLRAAEPVVVEWFRLVD